MLLRRDGLKEDQGVDSGAIRYPYKTTTIFMHYYLMDMRRPQKIDNEDCRVFLLRRRLALDIYEEQDYLLTKFRTYV